MKNKIENALSNIKTYDFKTLDYRLIFYCIVLSIIGILTINSATNGDRGLVFKQCIGLGLGLITMIVVMLVRYDFIARYYWFFYFINILLLLAVRFVGTYRGGAKRWIILMGIQIQPSELTKLFLLIFFSSLIAHNLMSLNSFKFFVFTVIMFIIPIGLIMLQPDLSTSIVIAFSFFVVLFVGGFSSKIFKNILLVILPIFAIVITLIIILPGDKNIIPEYQYNRLVGFYDPDNEIAEAIRYQQENSVTAIAGGGTTGKGLNNNSITSVKNAEFISEPQTDFIFTIIGEELGFFGSIGTILLIALIVFECFRIGIKARDTIGKCIAIGFGSLLSVQTFINIGVVTMIIPNTGLTLPFVSYGLSSLITTFLGVGLVLNVGLKKKMTF